MTRTLLLLALALVTSPVEARAPKPMPLIRAWAQANEACRGNIQVEARFDHNCWLRDAVISRKLEALGWVYGWDDVVGACQEWHRPGEHPTEPNCYFH